MFLNHLLGPIVYERVSSDIQVLIFSQGDVSDVAYMNNDRSQKIT